MTDRDQLKITFDSGGTAVPTGTAWVPRRIIRRAGAPPQPPTPRARG